MSLKLTPSISSLHTATKFNGPALVTLSSGRSLTIPNVMVALGRIAGRLQRRWYRDHPSDIEEDSSVIDVVGGILAQKKGVPGFFSHIQTIKRAFYAIENVLKQLPKEALTEASEAFVENINKVIHENLKEAPLAYRKEVAGALMGTSLGFTKPLIVEDAEADRQKVSEVLKHYRAWIPDHVQEEGEHLYATQKLLEPIEVARLVENLKERVYRDVRVWNILYRNLFNKIESDFTRLSKFLKKLRGWALVKRCLKLLRTNNLVGVLLNNDSFYHYDALLVDTSKKIVYAPSMILKYRQGIGEACTEAGYTFYCGAPLQSNNRTCASVALEILDYYLTRQQTPEIYKGVILLPPELLGYAESTKVFEEGMALWHEKYPLSAQKPVPAKVTFVSDPKQSSMPINPRLTVLSNYKYIESQAVELPKASASTRMGSVDRCG